MACMFSAILWPYKFADKLLRLSVLSQMGSLSYDDVNNLLFAFQLPKTEPSYTLFFFWEKSLQPMFFYGILQHKIMV